MFSDGRASNQGACARHQYETADGAEDPHREKRTEDAVFRRVGATHQHQRSRQRQGRTGAKRDFAASIALRQFDFHCQDRPGLTFALGHRVNNQLYWTKVSIPALLVTDRYVGLIDAGYPLLP
jgi:hypothetical protein